MFQKIWYSTKRKCSCNLLWWIEFRVKKKISCLCHILIIISLICSGASNIVFSNGLLDPWSGGGVMRSPNDKVKIIIIPEGAHHLDLRAANKNDPGSVRSARKLELQHIEEWIRYHYKTKHHQ